MEVDYYDQAIENCRSSACRLPYHVCRRAEHVDRIAVLRQILAQPRAITFLIHKDDLHFRRRDRSEQIQRGVLAHPAAQLRRYKALVPAVPRDLHIGCAQNTVALRLDKAVD